MIRNTSIHRRAAAGALSAYLAALTCTAAPAAVAQEGAPPGRAGVAQQAQEGVAQEGTGQEGGPQEGVATDPAAASEEPGIEVDPADPDAAAVDWAVVRDTSGCPFRSVTPGAVTETEAPSPDDEPEPLPVPEHPAGGERMGECGVVAADGFAVPEGIGASSWIVADAATGEVLAAKDPHGRYRPASIAKVLLAMVAFRDLPLDRKVETTEEDESIEGSRVGIQAGATFTVEELLLGLLMNSGNDAANALSRELGGPEETLRKVNDLAAELGATDTRIGNYDGLDAPGQSTSAFDMAVFYRRAFEDPEFRRLASTRLAELPTNVEGERFATSNDNGLLIHGYPGALGGKTGFTDDARHTFAGVAEQNGRTLVTIVLDSPAAELRPWEESWRLLDAGFATAAGSSVGNLDEGAAGDGAPEGADDGVLPDLGEAVGAGWATAAGVALLAVCAVAAAVLVVKRRRR
ncbi:serine hydrolase [Corynebacterium sp. 335C]